ncbi:MULTISPECIES: GNAT family N-acetyltransferase [unclassified Arthrobacter]|uniref:GNAT family N-acetyltransferase n=1 Tax=unclassified Arthrobacter TaxID=235627 RepID=UPI00159E0F44|nr:MULTISPECIES: GNAT family N-acetyltransferase [unclassified Arthrobacter]MCQ9164569.1 GNAT family N-acetyltransferase [Arthrobacter sp. STN4]NVM97136.1 GNAT family N-acetyltransferase [Arthrobacter sp. SDTb3-6]
MTFDLSSAPIVRLAWERHLGLPADSLVAGSSGGRITQSDDSGSLSFLRLWDQGVLTGPAELLRAAEAYSDDELSDHATMLRLSRGLGGRGCGTQALYYADDLRLKQPEGTVMVSHGNPEAVALEALCPPDDVNDVGLSGLPHKFTVMDSEEPGGGPLACAAYAEFAGMLAQLGTLVPPKFRRRGLGRRATEIAAHEALATGLIAQWRADVNNAGAHALAISTGFSVAGLQTSVALQPRQSPHK